MALQERDIQIMSYLLRYKYMSSIQVKRLFFKHQTATNMHRILRKLQSLKFIERIQFPRTPQTNLGSLLYLTPKGARCLAAEWGVKVGNLSYTRIVYPIQSTNHFLHRMHLVDFWIALDEDVGNSHIELKHLVTEFHKQQIGDQYFAKSTIQTKQKDIQLIPDICFTLQNPIKQTEVLFFVEIDTGKETIAGRLKLAKPGSLLQKYLYYERILVDGGWKNTVKTTAQAFLVLTVTKNMKHIQSVQERCKGILQYPNLFLFTTHEEIQEEGALFNLIWTALDNRQKKALVSKK